MDCIWFQTEEIQKTDSLDSTFLGVFNKDPSEIGSSLSRPITPFQPTNNIQPQLVSPIKPSTDIIYSQAAIFSNRINGYEPIIDHSVIKRRGSNTDCQFNLVPV